MLNYQIDCKALRKKMIDKNILTISELSNRTGLTRMTVTGIVEGTSKPTLSAMYKISDALGLSDLEAGKIFFALNVA